LGPTDYPAPALSTKFDKRKRNRSGRSLTQQTDWSRPLGATANMSIPIKVEEVWRYQYLNNASWITMIPYQDSYHDVSYVRTNLTSLYAIEIQE
jgi:hypothetical protein